MIYFISWRGRGLVALLVIFLAMALALMGAAFNDDLAGVKLGKMATVPCN